MFWICQAFLPWCITTFRVFIPILLDQQVLTSVTMSWAVLYQTGCGEMLPLSSVIYPEQFSMIWIMRGSLSHFHGPSLAVQIRVQLFAPQALSPRQSFLLCNSLKAPANSPRSNTSTPNLCCPIAPMHQCFYFPSTENRIFYDLSLVFYLGIY